MFGFAHGPGLSRTSWTKSFVSQDHQDPYVSFRGEIHPQPRCPGCAILDSFYDNPGGCLSVPWWRRAMPENRARKHHQQRVGEALREEITSIIEGELSDPRIGSAAVSEVHLAPDGKSARIFVF